MPRALSCLGALFSSLRELTTEHDRTFGSARFASDRHVAAAGLFKSGGFTLGYRSRFRANAFGCHPGWADLRYSGDRHRLIAAPARSGKFVSCVGPMLLDEVTSSALVLDVKGEAAVITRAHRGRGGPVYLLNPFNQFRMGTQGYNPMRLLDPRRATLVADAQLLTEAFVDPAPGSDKHFEDEGRSLLLTMILYVATAPEEDGRRTLNRVRTLLTQPAAEFGGLMKRLMTSTLAGGAVRQGANTFDQKTEKERSGVLSTAHRMTSFLQDPTITAVLRKDDFRFGDLKRQVATVYLIIPPSRISTHSTFLRLMVTAAAIEFERAPLETAEPVRVILDEFPLIGRLRAVEKAYSVQAGYGVQFHVIAQHFGQLRDAYGPFWETFVSSAGILQVFDTNDQFTAEYISKMLGETTVTSRSTSTTTTVSASSSVTRTPSRRRLLTADEIRTLKEHYPGRRGEPAGIQLLLPNGGYPILARRWRHYAHAPFAARAMKAPEL